MTPTINLELEQNRAKKASKDSLIYSIKDATEAYEATGLEKYLLQVAVYNGELLKRVEKNWYGYEN